MSGGSTTPRIHRWLPAQVGVRLDEPGNRATDAVADPPEGRGSSPAVAPRGRRAGGLAALVAARKAYVRSRRGTGSRHTRFRLRDPRALRLGCPAMPARLRPCRAGAEQPPPTGSLFAVCLAAADEGSASATSLLCARMPDHACANTKAARQIPPPAARDHASILNDAPTAWTASWPWRVGFVILTEFALATSPIASSFPALAF